MTKDEALKLALDTLESSRVFVTTCEKIKHPEGTEWYEECITAIREALAQPEQEEIEQAMLEVWQDVGDPRFPHIAQPEQEPVAWFSTLPDGRLSIKIVGKPTEGNWEPLYATPPQRKPLTDEQWQVIADTLDCLITRKQKDAIEAVIGIKE